MGGLRRISWVFWDKSRMHKMQIRFEVFLLFKRKTHPRDLVKEYFSLNTVELIYKSGFKVLFLLMRKVVTIFEFCKY